MKHQKIKPIVLSALFLALGIVLPFFTGQIKEIGDSLLPMHIPVMFCGLICGPGYGFAVGFLLPLLRACMFGMPPLYPNAVWMALELATYGGTIGAFYLRWKQKHMGYLYLSLILSMISGRLVWGVAKTCLLGLAGTRFSFQAFITGGLIDAIPGIVLQLILIPSVMGILHKKQFVQRRSR